MRVLTTWRAMSPLPTPVSPQSGNERSRCHSPLERILKIDRLRLRGPSGAPATNSTSQRPPKAPVTRQGHQTPRSSKKRPICAGLLQRCKRIHCFNGRGLAGKYQIGRIEYGKAFISKICIVLANSCCTPCSIALEWRPQPTLGQSSLIEGPVSDFSPKVCSWRSLLLPCSRSNGKTSTPPRRSTVASPIGKEPALMQWRL